MSIRPFALAALTLLLAACGSGVGPAPTTAPPQPPATATSAPVPLPTADSPIAVRDEPLPTPQPETVLLGGWLPAAAPTHGFAAFGSTAVVAQGNGLRVLDADTDPFSELGRLDLGTPATALAMPQPGVVYAATANGVLLVDISDPASPTTQRSGGDAATRLYADDTLVLAASDSTLTVLDAALNVLGETAVAGSITAVSRSGNIAAAGLASGQVAIVDVADPANPQPLAVWTPPSGGGVAVRDVAVSGTALLVVSDVDGLAIVSLSTPSNPFILTQYGGNEFARFVTLGLRGATGYVGVQGDPNGVLALGLSDPALPRPVGFYEAPNTIQTALPVGNDLYLRTAAGLTRLNADLSLPQVISRFPIEQGGAVVDAAAAGSRLYLALGGPGVQVLDMSDPANPVELDRWVGGGDVVGVTASDSHLFAVQRAGGALQLAVTEAGQPSASALYGLTDSGAAGDVHDVAYGDGVVAVAAGTGGLLLFNVADVAAPQFTAALPAFDARGVALAGPYAYVAVAGANNRLVVVAVANNTVVGELVLGGVPGGVAVSGSLAAVNTAGGLTVIDVADPAAPRVTGQFDVGTPTAAGDAWLVDDRAYTADAGTNQVRVYDLSDIALPRALAPYALTLTPAGLVIQPGYLAVFNPGEGLVTFARSPR